MHIPEAYLSKYFGYSTFRPLQKEIIEEIIAGNNTIALLPTGGGKSLCYQIPALMMNGMCIVVSPLIALMKDQVETLNSKQIPAVALYSSMSYNEINFELENCVNGKYKLLYISPERLQNQNFRSYIRNAEISFLAIDEAHCISQWGYDFRPPYLKITEFKEFIGNVPCIALTATATDIVLDDLKEKLNIKKCSVFKQSFVRNLAYYVLEEENKIEKIIQICQKVKGTGLIYTNNRKNTVEIAQILKQRGISADFYHAGLDINDRNKKQDQWKQNATRVMVCTNAFGMGIDKPDVRFVIHEHKPDNIEAYYQEAGRAGRDGKKSYCILLHHAHDSSIDNAKYQLKFPSITEINRIYNLVNNYLKIAIGSGQFHSYDFQLKEFCDYYDIPMPLTYYCLRLLEQEGFWTLTEAAYLPTRLKFTCSYETLYEWQLKDVDFNLLTSVLIRSYGGIFDYYTPIYERDLAYRTRRTELWVKKQLNKLASLQLVDFTAATTSPQIILLEERHKQIGIDEKKINFLRKRFIENNKQMNAYIANESICRNRFLANYFNENTKINCQVCDICVKQNKSTKIKITQHIDELRDLIAKPNFNINNIADFVRESNLESTINMLRWLKDNGYLTENKIGKWSWTEKKI